MEYLINRLALLFEMHGYDYPPDRMKYLITNMNKIFDLESLSKQQINEFINLVETGEYGVLFSQPTCITSMFLKFRRERINKMVY